MSVWAAVRLSGVCNPNMAYAENLSSHWNSLVLHGHGRWVQNDSELDESSVDRRLRWTGGSIQQKYRPPDSHARRRGRDGAIQRLGPMGKAGGTAMQIQQSTRRNGMRYAQPVHHMRNTGLHGNPYPNEEEEGKGPLLRTKDQTVNSENKFVVALPRTSNPTAVEHELPDRCRRCRCLDIPK